MLVNRDNSWIAAAVVAAVTAAFGMVAGGYPTVGPATGSQTPAAPSSSVLALRSVWASMSWSQRVGQLFVVGTPATGLATGTRTDIRRYHVGSVILTGQSSAGVDATAVLTGQLQALATRSATDRVGMIVAADQEGGSVQVLNGSGFTTMPTALEQGTWAPASLQRRATQWGQQLASAGVNLDLAPVADTVPAPLGTRNLPIGYWHREYGNTPVRVARHVRAFATGVSAAGVQVTLKHFPGLGRVRGNTDYSSGVTDHVTAFHDRYLHPFRVGVGSGAGFVMMSLAYYPRTGAYAPAAFSPRIVQGMLRKECGFAGVVVSDSLDARQVAFLTPGVRAVRFLRAGGDLALVTDPSDVPTMTRAVLAEVQHSRVFRRQVHRAVLTVLAAKQQMGLLPKVTSR